MRRLLSLSVMAVMASSSAWAQSAPQEEAAPDDEFVPWTGGSTAEPAPAPAVPPPPGKAKPPEKKEEKVEKKEGAAPTPIASDPNEWAAPPAETSAPPPSAPPVVPEVTPPPPAPPVTPDRGGSPDVRQQPRVEQRPPSPQEFNRVSIYGAPTLGQWNRGLGAYLGFPLLGLKAGIGLTDSLDVGLGFDSFYGVMNEPRAWAKFNVLDDKNWAVSLQVEGGAAFFTQKPEAEGQGARWLTGRRNYNLEPGVLFSYRGDSVQSARLFLDLRYHLAFDTQPWTKDPLGGVPPPVVLGHNFPVRLGAEMPFSPSTSFLFLFGFDVHTREGDSLFMPVVSVGLVTGL